MKVLCDNCSTAIDDDEVKRVTNSSYNMLCLCIPCRDSVFKRDWQTLNNRTALAELELRQPSNAIDYPAKGRFITLSPQARQIADKAVLLIVWALACYGMLSILTQIFN